jgi:type II secretory pathway component GspD/PulD (secretin)
MSNVRAWLSLTSALVAVLILSGCASQQSFQTADGVLGERETVEENLATAASVFRDGDYAEASRLLRGILGSNTSYRVMPDVLYLLGRAELGAGNTDKAALSFHLLRKYYPREWAVLPERAELGAIADTYAPKSPRVAVDAPASLAPDWLAEMSGGGPPVGARVTNLFYETGIQQVVLDVSAQTGVPILVTRSVRGLVTAEFHDLPLEECLDRLTVPLGLGYRWMDGYYLIGAVDDERDPGSMLTVETVEVRPKHLLAGSVLDLLPESYGQYVRKDPDGGNALTVTGPPGILSAFLEHLAAIDLPARQVVIEALVVELNNELLREWGIDWEILGSDGDGGTFRLAKLVPALADSSFIAKLVKSGVGLGSVTDVTLAVRALEAGGVAKVLANPRVATLDGHEARIRVGTEAYYSLLSGSVSYAYYTLQTIATGITLRITPYVGESSEITVDVFVEVSDVRSSGTNDLPVTNVREVETRACVGNGEAVVIGGLLSEVERTKESRIPILGSIPYLGALFGHTIIEKQQKELVILVTPHIVIHQSELAGLLQ